jgi:hypothetical protein
MVWKHVVQIESIDASGFILWANGVRLVITERSLQSAAFGMGKVLMFGPRV